MKKLANYAVIGLILVALVAITSCGTPFGINTAINGSYYMKEGSTEYFGVYFDSQTSYTFYKVKKTNISSPYVANHFTNYKVLPDSNDSSVFYVQRPNPTANMPDINVWRINKNDLSTIYNNESDSEYKKVKGNEFTAIFGNVGKSSWKTSDNMPVK